MFLLGGGGGQTAPLVARSTGHIAREARRSPALRPGGRLDPPLTLALDEAALICPVPLDQWTADMGGRGVTIHIAVAVPGTAGGPLGAAGAATILNNAATVLVSGGTGDPDDLIDWSTLAGERVDEDLGLVPVLSPAQIAQLPDRRVLIIRRATPAAVGTVRMAWKRRDVPCRPAGRSAAGMRRLPRWRRPARRCRSMPEAPALGRTPDPDPTEALAALAGQVERLRRPQEDADIAGLRSRPRRDDGRAGQPRVAGGRACRRRQQRSPTDPVLAVGHHRRWSAAEPGDRRHTARRPDRLARRRIRSGFPAEP